MIQKIRNDFSANNMKILEERLRHYEDEAANLVTIINIENLMNLDLCFVLDCTDYMSPYIKAAKEHILKVASYINSNNSNIKLWVGFCGYRDHSDGSDRLQNFDFTSSLEKFKTYIANKVKAIGGNDDPEDVLGGLNAAITEMTWSNATRVIIHIGDAPPHGHRFTNLSDDYSDEARKAYTLCNEKKLQINPHEPDWATHPEKILCHISPKTLTEVKDEYYFINSNFIEQDTTFKLALQPFAVGAE
ncbi:19079_t:CDS:2 [Cetraspora pellucida]|uniref:19079_t:CDS:1 n=1 Tax=Cetraspora pellucida TaxID=1433469 RepID=A0A9N9GTW7_9GLOM|nr:19079_t:CDS:2 [Cetraspora pellucida]